MTSMKPMKEGSTTIRDEQQAKDSLPHCATQARKRHSPALSQDKEAQTTAKKPRYSITLPCWEPPKTYIQPDSMGEGARPRRAKKRHGTSLDLFSPCSAKRRRYTDPPSGIESPCPCLKGEAEGAEGKGPDGPRNPPKAMLRPSPSSTDESCSSNKKPKHSSDTAPRRHLSSEEKKAAMVLRKIEDLGVPILEKGEVEAMTSAVCEPLGSGAYGSCCKTVDPHTQQEVVIKTFLGGDFDNFVTEVMNLQQCQMAGVQRLLGVCVDTC